MTDPRVEVTGTLLTVNEQLVHDTIRHMVVLERFKKSEVAKITRFLDEEVFPDIVAKIEGGLGAIASRGLKAIESKRLANTLTSVNAIIAKGVKEGMTRYAKDAKMLAAIEANWQVSSLTEAMPLAVRFNMPSPATLAAIVNNAPVNGKPTADWFDSLGASTFDKVKQQVSIGLAQGETVDQMVRRLRGTAAARFKDGVFATTKHQAQAIVRTTANDVSTRAREETYLANADVIKGVQLVATLDSRTTDICMGYDGQVFPVGEGPRPVFHISCRTTTVPVTKSWKELLEDTEFPGDKKPVPEGKKPKKPKKPTEEEEAEEAEEKKKKKEEAAEKKKKRGKWTEADHWEDWEEELGALTEEEIRQARASMNGQVPAKMTYGIWLKMQTKAVQIEALGPGRAALFRAGKITVKDLTNKFGAPLSLEQLRVKVAKKAAKAGVPALKVPKAKVSPLPKPKGEATLPAPPDFDESVRSFKQGEGYVQMDAEWYRMLDTELHKLDPLDTALPDSTVRTLVAHGLPESLIYKDSKELAQFMAKQRSAILPEIELVYKQIPEGRIYKMLEWDVREQLESGYAGIDGSLRKQLEEYGATNLPTGPFDKDDPVFDFLDRQLAGMSEAFQEEVAAQRAMKIPVTVRYSPAEVESILNEYITTPWGPERKAKLKQNAIDAGLVWTKEPKTLDDIDKIMERFQPSTGLSPAVKPSLTDEVRQELRKFLDLSTLTPNPEDARIDARSVWLTQKFEAGYMRRGVLAEEVGHIHLDLRQLGYKGELPTLAQLNNRSAWRKSNRGPWVSFVETLDTTKSKILDSTGVLRRLGYTDVLPVTEEGLQTILGVEAKPLFAPPAALDVKSLRYTALGDDLFLKRFDDEFVNFTPRSVEYMSRIQSAATKEELVSILNEYIGAEAISMSPSIDIETVRQTLYWYVRHTDGVQDLTRGGRAVTRLIFDKGDEIGPAFGMAWPDGRVQLNSDLWSTKERLRTIKMQRAHHQAALASDKLTWKTTDGLGGRSTIVHEFGHHFGEGWWDPKSLRWAEFDHKKGKFLDFTPRPVGGRAGEEGLMALNKAAQRYKVHVEPLLKSDWKLSEYARINAKEAWAETWARMVLQNEDQWDDLTKLAFTMIEEEYAKAGLKLPAILRKTSAPKGFVDISKWKQVGGQKGSNPGGLYQAPDGKKYYVKFYDDIDHVDNEVIANRLYREAGLNTPEVHHGYLEGRYAVLSEWQEGLTGAGEMFGETNGFATDAWLANWDVVGLEFDNLLKLEDAAYRVDAGGSLLFRARGAPKGAAFGDEVTELLTMRDYTKAPQAASIYAEMTDAQIVTSMSRVEAVTEEAIDTLVDKYWLGKNYTLRDELKLKLKTRRNNLLKERDALLDKLAAEHKLSQAGGEARKLGLHDSRPYDVRYDEWLDELEDPTQFSAYPERRRLEAKAIYNYSGSIYEDIRFYQRRGHQAYVDHLVDTRLENLMTERSKEAAMTIIEKDAAMIGQHAANINSALKRAPSYQGTIVRGMYGDHGAQVLPEFKVGSIVEFPEVNSFSRASVGPFQGNVQLEVRNSTKSGVDIAKLAAAEHEQEVLVRQGSRFRVVEVTRYSPDPHTWPDQYRGKFSANAEYNWHIILEEL